MLAIAPSVARYLINYGGSLCCEGPKEPKIEWPSTPDILFDETKLRTFAGAVVQTHKLAFQKIPIEVLVSFALNISSTGITSFLESHKKLAIQVEESRADAARIWAWDRASREVCRFELLKQAIQTELCGKSKKWNVLDPTENSLYMKTLSPIREIFERYSPSEFLKRLPLLSRRFMREGALDTDFSIYDEIIEYSSQRVDKTIIQAWLQRSREIHEYCAPLLDRNVPDGKEYFRHCKKVLRDDVLDILSVYPNLLLVLAELGEVLYLHGDLLSCGIIITGIEQLLGPVSTKWNMDLTSSVIGAKKSVVPFEI